MIFNVTTGNAYGLPELDSYYPADAAVTAGNPVMFHVSFSSHGYPAVYTYTWYVNGEVVEGATGPTYIRDTTADAGEYTVHCEVTNKAGTVTSRNAVLGVKCLPTLDPDLPADVTVNGDEGATFQVAISEEGYPADYTYQWYVNDSAVSGATGDSYTISGDEDTGCSVYCEVTNAAGTVKSRTATFTRSRLYIWNEGDVNSITGGWDEGTNSAVEDDGVSLGTSITVYGYNTCYAVTKKTIDMANYSKLCFVVSTPDGIPGSISAGAVSSTTGIYVDYAASSSITYSTHTTYEGTLSVDISALTGSYYVQLTTYMTKMVCSQIYME